MKVLVTGGTGTVGSQVVNDLVARGATVSVLTRDPAKATLPAGVAGVKGDLAEPASVREVFNGFEGVFLLNPVSKTEAYEGLMGVAGMRLAGVKRVVYLSVHDVEGASYLPHFGSKVGVEHAVRTSGMAWTILRPNNFYQNDYWFKDALQQFGVYPQPIGPTGISRVDVRDIGEAAAIAFTSAGHEGQTYDLVGPRAVTGEETARIWAEALGRPITYGGDDLDAWEQQFLQYMPDWMVFDFRLMYAHFQKNGLKATSSGARAAGEDARPRAAALRGLCEGNGGRLGDVGGLNPSDPFLQVSGCPALPSISWEGRALVPPPADPHARRKLNDHTTARRPAPGAHRLCPRGCQCPAPAPGPAARIRAPGAAIVG
jgi:uncharacterized protein YbjT (DUF2867 family)